MSSKAREAPQTSSATTTRTEALHGEQKPTVDDYDEDFSETSHSAANHTPSKQVHSKPGIEFTDIEDDFERPASAHDTNQSSRSKSSDDEQSEILVIGRQSASTTPRQLDESRSLDHPPVSACTEVPASASALADVDDEREKKIDHLTEALIRTFIDDAIDQGQDIVKVKNETQMRDDLSDDE